MSWQVQDVMDGERTCEAPQTEEIIKIIHVFPANIQIDRGNIG